MTLADKMNGPGWIVWAVLVIFIILSIIFISGHGINFIAGFNTLSAEEKEKYNIKKVCRVTGIGMAIIALIIFIMATFENVLPASFVYVALIVILIDCLVIIILANTICKK